MDLYIRSQDKMRLYKSNSQIIRIIDHKEKSEKFVILNDDKLNEPLGWYETEERAVEVLDEMQSAIEHNGTAYYDKKEDALYSLYGVYEMPKD